MSDLSSIVRVDINLSEPIVGSQSFGNILILGARPSAWTNWTASTAVTKGQITTASGNLYECTTAGTTGATAPSGRGSAINDGTVVWKFIHQAPPPVGVYSSLSEVEDYGFITVSNADSGVTADPIGAAARVAFSQNPRPTRIYIAVQQIESGTAEPWTDTLDRALRVDGWYVVCPAGVPENQFSTIAMWTEAQTKLFVYTFVGTNDPIAAKTYYRTAGYVGKVTEGQAAENVPSDNAYLGVAVAAKCLSYTPGSETWSFKSLSLIVPSEFTAAESDAFEASCTNYYENVAGRNVTRLGKVKAGEWIDVIRFRDWLQNDMQLRVANVLVQNPKVPYTNPGIALVENAMIASLKAGQINGGVSPDEYMEDGTMVPGYVVDVPDATEITAAQKKTRILNDCKFSAYLAGAIHVVEITGSLGYFN